MDEDIIEAREQDSSITQHCYFCTTNDRLTGRMEIFKHTHTHMHAYLTRCIKVLSSAWLALCVSVSVCVCPLSGPAVDGADLLGRREEEKGSGKAN